MLVLRISCNMPTHILFVTDISSDAASARTKLMASRMFNNCRS